MAGVNKVILVGNLGADPESRSFSNGGEVVNLRIATSEQWKDRDGNRRSNLEMRATSVGPDLARSIVRIIEKTASARDAGPTAEEAEVEAESDEATVANEVEDTEALPLSA